MGVMYGVTLDQIDKEHGGLAMLSPVNVINLNDLDKYISELTDRVKGATNV